MNNTGKLILARHHESEWNKEGKWTGTHNIGLTSYGFEMSRKMGHLIKDIPIDQAFASEQIRSLETLLCMEDGICIDVPIVRNKAINERDYGDYTGMNKWEVEKAIGEEQFEKVRRGWDVEVPHGETLKMVYERVLPFYMNTILPMIKEGKTVLVVAHGNSLRALMKYIEQISDDSVSDLEMMWGSVIIYDVDEQGHMLEKQVRSVDSYVPA